MIRYIAITALLSLVLGFGGTALAQTMEQDKTETKTQ